MSNEQEQQSQQYENDKIAVEVITKPHCRILLQVTVKPGFADKLHKSAIKNVSKEVSFPGFRKGKAPQEVLIRKFTKEIENEFRDHFVNEGFFEAAKLIEKPPLKNGRPKLSTLTCAPSGGTFKIEYDTFPNIPEIDPKVLHVPQQPGPNFSDDDVETQLNLLRYRSADWRLAEERAIAPGDSATVDVEITSEGQEPYLQEGTTLYIDERYMDKWMYPHLQGLKAGDVATGVVEHNKKESQQAEENFKITVKEVFTAELPAIDEKLSERFGIKTPEELKEAIKKQLEQQYHEQVGGLMRKIVQQELLKHYSFDLPETFIEEETEDRIKQRHEELRSQGTSEEEIKQELDAHKAEIRTSAERSLQLYFLIQQITTKQNIQTSEQETFMRMIQTVQKSSINLGSIPEDIRKRFMEKIHSQLTSEKALDWLVANATATEQTHSHEHEHCDHEHGKCDHKH